MTYGKRTFGPERQEALLREAREWRYRCVHVLGEAPIGSPVYRAVGGIMGAIDGLAEVVTGHRDHFHLKPHTTPPGGGF